MGSMAGFFMMVLKSAVLANMIVTSSNVFFNIKKIRWLVLKVNQLNTSQIVFGSTPFSIFLAILAGSIE